MHPTTRFAVNGTLAMIAAQAQSRASAHSEVLGRPGATAPFTQLRADVRREMTFL